MDRRNNQRTGMLQSGKALIESSSNIDILDISSQGIAFVCHKNLVVGSNCRLVMFNNNISLDVRVLESRPLKRRAKRFKIRAVFDVPTPTIANEISDVSSILSQAHYVPHEVINHTASEAITYDVGVFFPSNRLTEGKAALIEVSVERQLDQGGRYFVIELNKVTQVDSDALDLLLQINKTVVFEGGLLALITPSTVATDKLNLPSFKNLDEIYRCFTKNVSENTADKDSDSSHNNLSKKTTK